MYTDYLSQLQRGDQQILVYILNRLHITELPEPKNDETLTPYSFRVLSTNYLLGTIVWKGVVEWYVQ